MFLAQVRAEVQRLLDVSGATIVAAEAAYLRRQADQVSNRCLSHFVSAADLDAVHCVPARPLYAFVGQNGLVCHAWPTSSVMVSRHQQASSISEPATCPCAADTAAGGGVGGAVGLPPLRGRRQSGISGVCWYCCCCGNNSGGSGDHLTVVWDSST